MEERGAGTNVETTGTLESVPFAFIRGGLRGHSTLYILFRAPASLCLPLPPLFSSCPRRAPVNLSGLLSRFLVPLSAPRSVPPHVRADYALSFRNYFAYMPSRFTLLLSLSLSLSPQSTLVPPSLPPASTLRHYRPAFYKIYVCRRAGDVAAGYLFFQ